MNHSIKTTTWLNIISLGRPSHNVAMGALGKKTSQDARPEWAQ
jgi:hypothetical protein